uniref:Uncharacterized protein n=1 Tax=Leersia perrieri TaxID=77586 RepID=A0A0D9XRG6_9ORYZ
MQFLNVNVKDEHYFRGEDRIIIEFEWFQLFHKDALDKSLMLRHKRQGVYDVGFIDPYVMHAVNVVDNLEETERNILRFLRKQAHKTTILLPYVFSAWERFTSKEPGEWKLEYRRDRVAEED